MNNYIIIGRTNVGKSYLFNLFTDDRKNISIDIPNTTVDIIKHELVIKDTTFNIYDTPGYDDLKSFNEVMGRINLLELSNINYIYVVKDHLIEIDTKVSKIIFAKNKNIFLYLNNKIKNQDQIIENIYLQIYKVNEDGFAILRKKILFDNQSLNSSPQIISKSVSIFGKENTGKSTLFNILINKDLSLTSKILHTTRDSVEWNLTYKKLNLKIIDTAGFIRSKSKRKRGVLESESIKQSEKSLYNADLIILMLESISESRLDLTLIGELQKKNKSFIILVNKMDLIQDKDSFKKRFLNHLSKNHSFFNSLNIHFISTYKITQKKIMELIYTKIIEPFEFKTSYLNKTVKKINIELSKVTINSKSFKIFYITAFSINGKNYFKIFTNFKDSQIKSNTKTFIRKLLINEFNLKGYAFNVIYN